MLKTLFKISFRSILFLSTFFLYNQNLSAQCPGCIVDLPPLPTDTIYLSTIPDGEVFVPYEADLSFRLPMSTTPINAVDPSVPAGLPIDEFNITSVTGLPPGLNWEANQLNYDVSVETDGCVRICGTPIAADSFIVNVNITVIVFGIPNDSSIPVSIYIAPSTSTNSGFSISNNSGCGETTVEFTNNNPSNGDPNFSYSWDFGNNTTSTDEDPAPVTYTEPGTYIVEYEATIDTVTNILLMVNVEASDCDDAIGDPDFYVIVTDPQGEAVFTTGVVNNTPPPVSFIVNVPLGPGNYGVEVYDDELIGTQSCGSVNFNENTTGSLFDGELEVTLNILNPMVIIEASDTITIYEIPAAPVITEIIELPCVGDEIVLEILENNYPDNLQWYQDTVAIIDATEDMLSVTEPGVYWVEYTSPDGCIAMSNVVNIQYQELPLLPVFTETDNILSVFDVDNLPIGFTLSWYLGEDLISMGQELEICAEESGLYTLIVEDGLTGCTATYELEVEINPEIDCTVNTEELLLATAVQVYPNPFQDYIQVELGNTLNESLDIRLFGTDGKVYWQGFGNPGEILEIAASDLPSGFYMLQWQSPTATQVMKLIKR